MTLHHQSVLAAIRHAPKISKSEAQLLQAAQIHAKAAGLLNPQTRKAMQAVIALAGKPEAQNVS